MDAQVKPGHDEFEYRGADGACAKSGLRSRLMILALRILYFEDLSVGMTDFASMHDGA
jgi:hypothetical protein